MNANKNNPFLPWAIILLGFTSIVAQVLIMRELVVIFYGNELSLGVMLGTWLLWTAVGSALLSRMTARIGSPSLHALQFVLALLLPAMLWVVRASKNILSITLGEMIGFTPMLMVTLITLAPLCLLNGLLFPVACEEFRKRSGETARSIGSVYLLESIGAGLGGLAASFILFRYAGSFHTLLTLSLLNCLSALHVGRILPLRTRASSHACMAAVLIVYGSIAFGLSGAVQRLTNRTLWKGYELIASKHTIYGNIAATRMGDQTSFFENGLLVFTAPDRLTAEESVHFVLLEHPNPRRVLLVGGGVGGAIRETLLHPSVEEVSYVELDPASVFLAQQLLPAEHTESLRDPRVLIHHSDGRRFIKETSRKYDVVILNMPDPYTAQLNRLYTLEFFREVSKKLLDGGVFAIQASSSENAIGPELSDFLSALWTTLKTVFPDIVILPGETARFIASKTPDALTSDPNVLMRRLNERNIQTLYVREYYIPYQMNDERQAFLLDRIHPVPEDKINRDFKPIGYYYDTMLWSTTYSSTFKRIFFIFSRWNARHVAGFFALLTLIVILFRSRKRPSTGILYSVFGIGFSEISLEVIILLSFQILHGVVYALLSVIIAGYMIGLSFGS